LAVKSCFVLKLVSANIQKKYFGDYNFNKNSIFTSYLIQKL